MASISDDIESGEVLLTVAAAAVVIYFIMKFSQQLADTAKSAKDAVTKYLPAQPKVVGLFPWVGSGQPLTAAQAQTVAKILGAGYNYTFPTPPDNLQVWFYSGAYYDNRDNHVYDVNGVDQGQALNPDGTAGGQAAQAATAPVSANINQEAVTAA